MASKFAKLRALSKLLDEVTTMDDPAELDLGLERKVYVVLEVPTTERDVMKGLGRILNRLQVIYGKGITMYGPIGISDNGDTLGVEEIQPYNFKES